MPFSGSPSPAEEEVEDREEPAAEAEGESVEEEAPKRKKKTGRKKLNSDAVQRDQPTRNPLPDWIKREVKPVYLPSLTALYTRNRCRPSVEAANSACLLGLVGGKSCACLNGGERVSTTHSLVGHLGLPGHAAAAIRLLLWGGFGRAGRDYPSHLRDEPLQAY